MQGSRQRPYKVWSADRSLRKGVTASNLQELVLKGKVKLSLQESDINVLLESDGTEIDDDRYFQMLEDNTVFVFLRVGEKWYPPGVEAIRAGTDEIDFVAMHFNPITKLKELKTNLFNIISMTESHLQLLANVELDSYLESDGNELCRIQQFCISLLNERKEIKEAVESLQLIQSSQLHKEASEKRRKSETNSVSKRHHRADDKK